MRGSFGSVDAPWPEPDRQVPYAAVAILEEAAAAARCTWDDAINRPDIQQRVQPMLLSRLRGLFRDWRSVADSLNAATGVPVAEWAADQLAGVLCNLTEDTSTLALGLAGFGKTVLAKGTVAARKIMAEQARAGQPPPRSSQHQATGLTHNATRNVDGDKPFGALFGVNFLESQMVQRGYPPFQEQVYKDMNPYKLAKSGVGLQLTWDEIKPYGWQPGQPNAKKIDQLQEFLTMLVDEVFQVPPHIWDIVQAMVRDRAPQLRIDTCGDPLQGFPPVSYEQTVPPPGQTRPPTQPPMAAKNVLHSRSFYMAGQTAADGSQMPDVLVLPLVLKFQRGNGAADDQLRGLYRMVCSLFSVESTSSFRCWCVCMCVGFECGSALCRQCVTWLILMTA